MVGLKQIHTRGKFLSNMVLFCKMLENTCPALRCFFFFLREVLFHWLILLLFPYMFSFAAAGRCAHQGLHVNGSLPLPRPPGGKRAEPSGTVALPISAPAPRHSPSLRRWLSTFAYPGDVLQPRARTACRVPRALAVQQSSRVCMDTH